MTPPPNMLDSLAMLSPYPLLSLNGSEKCFATITKGEGISTDVNYAISNSLGFGGHNASLLVKRFEE